LSRRDLEVRLVVGPLCSEREALRRELEAGSGQSELLASVGDMSEPMAWADLAITAAGSTCWELAFMGVPMITLTVCPARCSERK
jgi:spore coat polysaccharide biosynthesis predicted glycosyltransferase SpsG